MIVFVASFCDVIVVRGATESVTYVLQRGRAHNGKIPYDIYLSMISYCNVIEKINYFDLIT